MSIAAANTRAERPLPLRRLLHRHYLGLRQINNNWENAILLASGRNISSFGQDENGELYVVDIRGEVLRVASEN
jgi:hypothetical protein